MPKKTATVPMEPVSPAKAAPETTASTARPDPTLLGVSVPLNVTFAAAKELGEAWRECLVSLFTAIKAKLKLPGTEEGAPAATTDPSLPSA